MDGERDLPLLLASMEPELALEDFVFCRSAESFKDLAALGPWALVAEREGATLILDRRAAERAGLPFQAVFKRLSLTVHSSLEAVGLTAAVASTLAAAGISANVVAAFHHDHIFVPADRAGEALRLLRELGERSRACG